MNPADVLVGAVSAVAGGLGIAAGVANWEQCYQSHKVRWLVQRIGRKRTRWIYVGGGILFIVLGIAIACGYALNRPAARREGRQAGVEGSSWGGGRYLIPVPPGELALSDAIDICLAAM